MTGRRRARGELEAALLRALWQGEEPLSAQELAGRLPGTTPAVTTVLTALERLRVKGEVVRVGGARGVRFAAARSESEFTGEAMLATLADSGDRTAALLKFAGSLDPEDVAALRRALDPPPEA
ncbi:transcriptional regulator [Auraticoccus sp. F435]|uniref:Transcriptional regulator n=1 Tax=Auraticoccus cholistanensis TaxID=2656650 RepID=A0A6A9V024_9ACTN|nr:BlaI/MecI/CopY family transcriptional regulator [Auraticoccus cholistanensis]MVA74849.1 transcriptional regulator [Auraticoccus cholistanensis]